MTRRSPTARTDRGQHFSCSMSAVLLARVNAFGGPRAVAEVLRLAGSRRTPAYLLDITNWIAYDEAVALWQAGARVTHHPQFARALGVDAARRLESSPMAAMLRSLGAPENVYRAISNGAAEISTVTKLEVTKAGSGFAEVDASAAEGFPRSVEHCSWTCGLMTWPPVLFGLGPATVEHEECQAMGAARCVYHVAWDTSAEAQHDEGIAEHLDEVHARDVASPLEGGSAPAEAEARGDQSSALLSLARALAAAGTSNQVARRLADAVPLVVDCDRVGVCLWDPARGVLVPRADTTRGGAVEPGSRGWVPVPGTPLGRLIGDSSGAPLFVEDTVEDPQLRLMLAQLDLAAAILVPIAAAGSCLGMLIISVLDRPHRLKPTPELLDRVSSVAAQATTALQNGRLLDEMTHQALHDQLTGLANRLQFTKQLRGAIERARENLHPVTLLYMDLDGFKPVNDEFGHDVGDRLLVAVAKRLNACTRDEDTVARLGGDEFAVLVDSRTGPHDAEVVSERLARALTEPFTIDGHHLQLGASIGRAAFPIDAEDPDGLLRVADAAMFEVKRGTRARSVNPPRER